MREVSSQHWQCYMNWRGAKGAPETSCKLQQRGCKMRRFQEMVVQVVDEFTPINKLDPQDRDDGKAELSLALLDAERLIDRCRGDAQVIRYLRRAAANIILRLQFGSISNDGKFLRSSPPNNVVHTDVWSDAPRLFSADMSEYEPEDQAMAHCILGVLPESIRQVVLLRADGNTWDEIGQACGYAPTTVANRLESARAICREAGVV